MSLTRLSKCLSKCKSVLSAADILLLSVPDKETVHILRQRDFRQVGVAERPLQIGHHLIRVQELEVHVDGAAVSAPKGCAVVPGRLVIHPVAEVPAGQILDPAVRKDSVTSASSREGLLIQ